MNRVRILLVTIFLLAIVAALSGIATLDRSGASAVSIPSVSGGMWVTGEPSEDGYYWVNTSDPADFVPQGVKAPALWHGRWDIAGVEGGTPVFFYYTVPLVAPPEKK